MEGIKMHRFLGLWRSVVAMLLSAITLMTVGCQGPGALGAPEQTTVRSTQTPGETAPTPTPTTTGGSAPTSEPTPSLPPTQTPTPDASPTPPPPTELAVAPSVGATAPDLVLPDLSGNEVSLRGLRGKAVLLNFWASW